MTKWTMWTCLLILTIRCSGQVKNDNPNATPPVFAGAKPAILTARDTSPGWSQAGQKLLITGTVFQADGRTPAPNVEVYYYHTNTAGKYPQSDHPRNMPPNEQGHSHGYLRGWVKTGPDGQYFIYTVRPGAYPGREDPAHIHLTVTEPDGQAYYIDDVVFDDDRLLTTQRRRKMEYRGGSGVVRLAFDAEKLAIGERNIILGLNIPGHPGALTDTLPGPAMGTDAMSFIPEHAWGPDKGSRACPVCKYGWYHGILYFVGDNPDWQKVKKWLVWLERQSQEKGQFLKVYFIYGDASRHDHRQRMATLEALGRELNLTRTALTFVPSFTDQDSEIDTYRIPQNTLGFFILYKRNQVVGKWENLEPNAANFQKITDRLTETANDYFYLPK